RLIAEFLADERRLIESLRLDGLSPGVLSRVLGRAGELVPRFESGMASTQLDTFVDICERVVIGAEQISVQLKRDALIARLFGGESDEFLDRRADAPLTIQARIELSRRGVETRLHVEGCTNQAGPGADLPLLRAIARGHVWFDELVAGRVESI